MLNFLRRKVAKTASTEPISGPTVGVAAYALYVRGRRLHPGAAAYGYAGDVAATNMHPVLGTGRAVGGFINTRFQTLPVLRQVNINGMGQTYGQLATVGLLDDPNLVGSGTPYGGED